MTTCDVCGTANESSLTFCRHCGNRIKAKRLRPPSGDEADASDAIAAAAVSEVEEASELAGRRSRPPAPALDLKRMKRRKAPALRPREQPQDAREQPQQDERGAGLETEAVEADEAARPAAERRRCARCGAANPRGYRYCISCGGVLSGSGETRPAKANTSVGGLGGQTSGAAAADQHDEAAVAHAAEEPSPPARRAGADRAEAERARQKQELAQARKHAQEQMAKQQAAAARLPADDEEHAAAEESRPEPFPLADAPLKGWHQRRDEAEQSRVTVQSGEPLPAAPAAAASTAEGVAEVTGQLVIIVEDGSEGRRLDLTGDRVDLGRSEGDIVLAEDRYLSPRHARFYREQDRWHVRDLGSFNGVYRRLRQRAPLRAGDRILLGLEVLQLELLSKDERSLGQAVQHGVLAFGSPATKRRARLLQRTVEGVVRDVYHLVAAETTIGRETGDIVFTSDPFMSRRHAAIVWDDQASSFSLADLGSSNGTYLAIREDVALEHGDYIRLGQHLFRVDLPRRAKFR